MEYGKSINDRICLSPCINGTPSIHPLYLLSIQQNYPYCFTHIYTKNNKSEITDKCKMEINETNTVPNTNFISVPSFFYNTEHFLKNIYKINSLDDALKWIKNNPDKSVSTHMRIIECSLVVFKLDDIVDPYLISFIKNILIYKGFSKDIVTKENIILTIQNMNNGKTLIDNFKEITQ